MKTYTVLLMLLCSFSILSITLPLKADLSDSSRGNGMPSTTGERYYHYDHNHNVVMVADASGNVDNQLAYLPYGALYDASGTNDFRYKWGAKELDDATGLYYFGARYYSPVLERFITPDPAKQYDSPYIYGGGDPLNKYDADGRKAHDSHHSTHVKGLVMNTRLRHNGHHIGYHTNMSRAQKQLASELVMVAAVLTEIAITAAAPEMAPMAALAFEAAVGGVVWGAESVAEAAMDGRSGKSLGVAAANGAAWGAGGPIGGAIAEHALGAAARGIAAMASRATIDVATEESGPAIRAAESAKSAESAGSAGSTECLVCKCRASFVAGTDISTDAGSTDIDTIEAGDKVWSFNETSQALELKPVTQTFTRIAPGIVTLTTETDTNDTTVEHPFYVEGEWIKAKDLSLNDRLTLKDGREVTITGITFDASPTQVFNFEVADNHNYYAGDSEVLVHNPGGCPPEARAQAFQHAQEVANNRTFFIGIDTVDNTLREGIHPLPGNDSIRLYMSEEYPEPLNNAYHVEVNINEADITGGHVDGVHLTGTPDDPLRHVGMVPNARINNIFDMTGPAGVVRRVQVVPRPL